jgi:putative oxidoreductase
MKLGRLILRATIGAFFVGHGTQKLFGWFGGHGVEGTGAFFESLGLKPGKANAIAAGTAEAGGGVLLATGFLTPLAASAIGGTMVTAIRHVHAAKGPWMTEGGYEYNAVILAALAAIVDDGPGPISLDRAFGIERSGFGWALASLGAGATGSFISSEIGKRMAQRAEPVSVPFHAAQEPSQDAPGQRTDGPAVSSRTD